MENFDWEVAKLPHIIENASSKNPWINFYLSLAAVSLHLNRKMTSFR